MPITHLEQIEIANSGQEVDTLLDFSSAVSSDSLEKDLNYIRSVLKKIIGNSRWHDISNLKTLVDISNFINFVSTQPNQISANSIDFSTVNTPDTYQAVLRNSTDWQKLSGLVPGINNLHKLLWAYISFTTADIDAAIQNTPTIVNLNASLGNNTQRLQSQIDSINITLSNHSSRISSLETDVTDTNNTSSIINRLSLAEQNITNISNTLNTATVNISNLIPRVNTLEGTVSNILTALGNFNITDYNNTISNINNNISLANNRIDNLTSIVTQISNNLGTFTFSDYTNTIATINGNITALDSRITTVNTNLSQQISTVNTNLQAAINSTNNNLGLLSGRVYSLETNVGAFNYNNYQATITAINSNIGNINIITSQNSTYINSLKDNINLEILPNLKRNLGKNSFILDFKNYNYFDTSLLQNNRFNTILFNFISLLTTIYLVDIIYFQFPLDKLTTTDINNLNQDLTQLKTAIYQNLNKKIKIGIYIDLYKAFSDTTYNAFSTASNNFTQKISSIFTNTNFIYIDALLLGPLDAIEYLLFG